MTGATEHERRLSYDRAWKLIGKLRYINVPTRMRAEIESKHMSLIGE